MTIDALKFGKNLRPSTVNTMNKVNEIITAVNQISPPEIDALEQKVETLATNVASLQTNLAATNKSVATNTTNIQTNSEDIAAIKVTLYTPLASDETAN